MLVGWLIGIFAPSFGEKGGRLAAYGVIILGAALLLFGGWELLKHSIIANHDLKQNQQVIENTASANVNAAESRGTDNARLAQEQREAQEAIDHAKATGGDPRAAYYHCIELQQRARQAGDPAPQCG